MDCVKLTGGAVPSAEEVEFVLEILDKIASPALDKIERLLESAGRWDSVARNDFCRYVHIVFRALKRALEKLTTTLVSFLHPVRSIWSGLPTFLKEGEKEVAHPCFYPDIEHPELLVTPLDVQAGFVLESPADPRYKQATAHRERFGQVIHRAANALQHTQEGEDHIDAVITVSKAIDVYLLEYAMTRSSFESLQQAYTVSRECVCACTCLAGEC